MNIWNSQKHMLLVYFQLTYQNQVFAMVSCGFARFGPTTALGSGFVCAVQKRDYVKKDDRYPLGAVWMDSATVPEITPCYLSDLFINALVNPNCMWLPSCTFLSRSGELGLVWVFRSLWMKSRCSLEHYVVWESPVLWKHAARISEPGLMRWPDVSAPAGAVPKIAPISYC